MSEYEYSKFAEWLQNQQDNIDPIVSQISNEEISELMLLMNWADVDQDNELYDILRNKGLKDTIDTAKKRNEPQHLQMLTGLESSTDASQWASEILTRKLWKPSDIDQMLNLVIIGPKPSIAKGSNTGAGKTDFGYTAIDGGIKGYALENKDLKVITTNDSDPFTSMSSYAELLWFVRNKDGTKVAMIDEASQGLLYSDMNEGKVLSNLIKLLRKHQCHLILIGHTGRDIPAEVRRQVVFAKKEDKKTVKLGNGLESDEDGRMDIANVEYQLKNLPATEIDYESIDDMAEFEWNVDAPAKRPSDLRDDEDTEQLEDRPVCGELLPSQETEPDLYEDVREDTKKERAVREYLNSDDGYRTVADNYDDVSYRTLKNWVDNSEIEV